MDWLKTLVPLLETGLKLYMSGKMVQKTAENAKDMAIRSAVFIGGLAVFLVFFMAAIIMSFVDLGHQLDAQNGIQFSGMMQSGLYLTLFGLLILGGCMFAAKRMEKRDQKKQDLPSPIEKHPYASLIIFAEQFLKIWTEQIKQPRAEAPAAPAEQHHHDHHHEHPEKPARRGNHEK